MAADPDALLLDFFSTTYVAAADAGAWNRSALECSIGVPARVRPLEHHSLGHASDDDAVN
jgi:hypothetical protein